MGGHVGPMWDLCWAHVGAFGSYMGSHGGLWGDKKTTQPKPFRLEVFSGAMLCQGWGIWSLCWAHVGRMLGHLGAIWASMEVSGVTKKKTQPKPFRLEVFSGAMLGQGWGIWSLCWAHVGRMLGHLGAIWASMEVSGVTKKNPTETFSVGGNFEGYVGPRLGHLESMLGPCWVHVGAFVGYMGFHGGLWGEKLTPTETFSVGGNFGAVLGQGWPIWGPYRAHVGGL